MAGSYQSPLMGFIGMKQGADKTKNLIGAIKKDTDKAYKKATKAVKKKAKKK